MDSGERLKLAEHEADLYQLVVLSLRNKQTF